MNILSWNINGLKRKLCEQDFLDYLNEYDIVFFNETWLSKHDTYNFDINNFCVEHIYGNKSKNIRKGRFSGGISFYYRSNLKKHVKIVEKNDYGILWVKISAELFDFEEDVYICHTYIPPIDSKVLNYANFDFFEQIELDIIKYTDLGKVFVTGDLNSRTSDFPDCIEFDKYLDENLTFVNTRDIPIRVNKDHVIDYYGRRLLETCQTTGLLIANGRLLGDRHRGHFTFCSGRGLSTVDYLLLDSCDFETLLYFEVKDFNEFSDHAPLMFSFARKNRVAPRAPSAERKTSDKLTWDENKIPLFRTKLLNINENVQQLIRDVTSEPVDHVVHTFSTLLSETAFEVFGTNRGGSIRGKMSKLKNKWFDAQCFEARKEFKRARNLFNRNKTDDTRTSFVTARTHYNKIKKKAKNKFKIEEGRRINNLAKSQPRKFWKNIKNTFKNNDDKAETLTVDELRDHFKSVFGEDHDNKNQNFIFDENSNDEELDIEITESEMHDAVFSQNNNKAPGTDGMISEIFKAAYNIIAPFLLKLYNRLFINGEYPLTWGEGIITPIFKKGDVNNAQNYRGITLINILAKIYSQILLNRLTKWTVKYDKICNNQFGFQKNKSVVDCLFILHTVVSKVLDSGNKLYCIFIDYEKCFDKIDRSFLWQKLLSENISSKFVRAIKSMYSRVKSCIKFNSSFSDFFDTHIGLKQGDPSSPLLFMLFVNDLNNSINTDLNDIFTIDELKLFLILFADDQALFAKSPESLQSMLTDIERYCRHWGLKINTDKTKAMIFEKGRHTHHDFFIYDTPIQIVESFKYLGVTLFKNGNWYRTQKRVAQHASFALHKLFTVFQHIELPIYQKCKLFDSLVGSILNFGSEIWGMHEATDVELIHTKFIRRILGVKKSTNLAALYGEVGRVPLLIFRKINIMRYWAKILKQNDNSILKQCYTLLKSDADAGRTYGNKNWAYSIRETLASHGLMYIWENQFDTEIPLNIIKQRLIDTYLQKWYTEINNSNRLQTYCIFKHSFELENYLDIIRENKYRVTLSRFRTSSHNLNIETGRYENLPREQRICKSCNMKKVETEYHFLLVCPRYRELRIKFFKPYYCHWPNLFKFETILASKSKKTIFALSKYLYCANQIRIS